MTRLSITLAACLAGCRCAGEPDLDHRQYLAEAATAEQRHSVPIHPRFELLCEGRAYPASGPPFDWAAPDSALAGISHAWWSYAPATEETGWYTAVLGADDLSASDPDEASWLLTGPVGPFGAGIEGSEVHVAVQPNRDDPGHPAASCDEDVPPGALTLLLVSVLPRL